jgi:GNAT superfamily N-acetyltransferase
MSLDVVVTGDPPSEAFQVLWTPLLRFNEQKAGNTKSRTLAILLSEPATGKVVGGLWGAVSVGLMYIDVIFVPERLRRTGVGSKVMQRAEAEAIRRGCHGIWLDTYNFQATRSFYERLGFTVFGVIEGPPPIFPHFFLKKDV